MNIDLFLEESSAVQDGRNHYTLELEIKDRKYTARLFLEHAELYVIALNILSVIAVNNIHNPHYIFNWRGPDTEQRTATIEHHTEMLYYNEAYRRTLSSSFSSVVPEA